MKVTLKKGSTSNILQVFIADSSSTTGAGLTGLAFGTSGLTAYYHRDTDTTATAMTLVTMTSGTFTSLGFKEIDATNMPGWYQLCPPNAAFATGAGSCAIHLKGAANMAPLPIEVQLVAYDPQDATALGLADLDTNIGSRSTYAGADTAGTTTLLGRLTSTRAGNLDDLDATISSRSTYAGGAVASVTAPVTIGTNSDKTGYSLTTAEESAIAAKILATPAHLLATDASGDVTLTTGEHANIVSDVNSALDAAGTELSAVPGATGTLRQKITMVFQYLVFKRTTTASTETAFKADSSTTLGSSTVSDDGTTATHGKVS